VVPFVQPVVPANTQVRPLEAAPLRAESTLMSVAGVSVPQQQLPLAVATNAEVSADVPIEKKKKGSGCSRCGKPSHCLNDCTEVICDCC
jgi:hypothetical protein